MTATPPDRRGDNRPTSGGQFNPGAIQKLTTSGDTLRGWEVSRELVAIQMAIQVPLVHYYIFKPPELSGKTA